jgi:hypothetical protein
MASELRVNTLKDASGNNSVATSVVFNGSGKAWANVNQTGTQGIQDSYNISGITDDAVGKTTFAISSNMSSANFSTSLCSANNGMQGIVAQAAGSVSNANLNSSGSFEDRVNTCLIVMGDLA